MSNLKQIGIAMQLFVNDNEDRLPGPVWSGAMASYDKNSSQELIYYIADYLDSQNPESVPAGRPVVAEVFVCPGYLRYAPKVTTMKGRKCYLLNDNVNTAEEAERVRPFGYPEIEDPPTALVPPLKFSELESYCSPSSTHAITDVDRINVYDPTVSWQSDLPNTPVHGRVRNKLFFDWHVASDLVNY